MAGTTGAEGKLPINPSGGLKARGHPVGGSGLAQVVEVAKRLRGQIPSKREFKRGLTQSTGGLATNNFVTILERADLSTAQNTGAYLFSAPPPLSRKKPGTAARISNEGEIETFTIVYVTPDGFLPPLALALIRQRNGHLIMAQGEDIEHLKIGREVYVRRADDFYIFTVKSQLQKVQESFRKLLRRKTESAPRERNAMDEKL